MSLGYGNNASNAPAGAEYDSNCPWNADDAACIEGHEEEDICPDCDGCRECGACECEEEEDE